MSISAIAAAGLSSIANVQRNYQQVRGEFRQLGQDLLTGNLAQAQTDFVTLSQAAAIQLSSNSPVNQAMAAVGLQSGNPSAAQQPSRNQASPAAGPIANAHRPPRGPFAQPLNQLAQALQSGNLQAAQQAFSSFQQLWQQFAGDGYGSPTTSVSA